MPQLALTILNSTDNTLEAVGDKYPGDGYYGHSDGLHTVAWKLNNFIGRIKIQATLVTEPTTDDWVDIDLDNSENGYVEYSSATSGSFSYNFTGNWMWVRAVVTRSYDPDRTLLNSGVVSSITYNF
mgnify:CR=1 FL=1